MATVFENYDAARTAFINPGDCVKAQENFPEVCITTFSESIIEDFAKKNSAEKIAELYTANGVLPVYGIEYAGIRMAFYLSRVGAPACVCLLYTSRRCEDACTRGTVDQAVAIDEVKKFIARQDLEAENRYIPPIVPPTTGRLFEEKIARCV